MKNWLKHNLLLCIILMACIVCGCDEEKVLYISDIGTIHIWDEDCEREIVTNAIPYSYIICNHCGEVYLLDDDGLASIPSPVKVLELVERERKQDEQDRKYHEIHYKDIEYESWTDYDRIEEKARTRLHKVQLDEYRAKGYIVKRINDFETSDLTMKDCWMVYPPLK